MTTTPHRRHNGASTRPPATPAAGRRAPRPAPLTYLGGEWVPGHSMLLPPLYWLLVALATLAGQYLHPNRWYAGCILGAITAIVAGALWAGTRDTKLVVDDERRRNEQVPLYHPAARAWLALTAVALGAWCTGVTYTGRAYTAPAWWYLGITFVVSCVSWPAVRHAQINHEVWAREKLAGLLPAEPEPEPEFVQPAPARDPRCGEWEKLLNVAQIKAGAERRGVIVLAEHPGECGPVLHLRMPVDMSVTYEILIQSQERLCGVIGQTMPDGLRPGAVRIQRAKNRHGQYIAQEVYVYIDVEDILSKITWLPEEHGPLTIAKAFPIGKFVDGTIIYLSLATIHAMVAGATRNGKSNLLHVLIFQLSRCVDALIWMYDGKGGATGALWVEAFLRGDIDPATGEPLGVAVLDWLALDRFEFERMMLAAIHIAKVRPGIRRARGLADPNYQVGDKWRPTTQDPAIFVIADEVAESVGAHTGPSWSSSTAGANSNDMGKLLTQLLALGCGEGIHVIAAGQRGTVTMFGSGDGKAQMGVRIALPMNSTGDGSEIFQKSPRASIKLAQLTHPGSVVVEASGMPEALEGKIFLTGSETNIARRIRKWSAIHAAWRPELDDETYDATLKFGYETRWQDEDRTWWARGLTEPPATLRRYSEPAPEERLAAGTATAGGIEIPANLAGVASPFAAAFDGPTGRPDVDKPDRPLDADETAKWDAMEAEHGAEMRKAAARALDTGGPLVDDTDEPDQGATGYQRFVQLVQDSAAHGITIPQVYELMVAEGTAPENPKTLYTWRDKAQRRQVLDQPVKGRSAPMYDAKYTR